MRVRERVRSRARVCACACVCAFVCECVNVWGVGMCVRVCVYVCVRCALCIFAPSKLAFIEIPELYAKIDIWRISIYYHRHFEFM